MPAGESSGSRCATLEAGWEPPGAVSSEALAQLDIALVRADNPGPLTLAGTNSWIVGRDPAWVVDPGPALEEHLDAVAAELARRGGAGGIALTHSHADHADGLHGLRARLAPGVDVGSATGGDRALVDGARFGPLVAISLPGHAPDHLGFIVRDSVATACFTGDAVLGQGSVFVADDMKGYLDGLARLKALSPTVLCPGHGPVVTDPAPHIDSYVTHRLERERRVVEALAGGMHDEEDLLTAIWGPVAPRLRKAARATLRAHLTKLRDEGRMPV